MGQFRKATAAVIVGLGTLALLAAPGSAAVAHGAQDTGAPQKPAHMGRGQGGASSGQPCPGGTMGRQDMMAPGMMGKQGMPGAGMMAPQGMMRPGMGSPGASGAGLGHGPGFGGRVVPAKDLTTDDVRHFLEHRLEWRGNKRLKVGEVKEADDAAIVAEITTVDDSLVERLEVDRHSGKIRRVE